MKKYKEAVLAFFLTAAVVVTQLSIPFFSKFSVGIVLLLAFEVGRMYGLKDASATKRTK